MADTMQQATPTANADVSTQLEDIRDLLSRRGDAGESGPRRLDQLLMTAGSVMLPLGIVAIGLSWYGASRTPYLFDQIPYLISGGLLGVGLVIAGGLMFFGSWIVAAGTQNALQSEQVVDAINALRRDLDTRLDAGGGLGRSGDAARTPTRQLVATTTGTVLHREDCSVVVRRDAAALIEVQTADLADYGACKLCDPLTS